MRKVLLIHGYGGSPETLWFPWLKKSLEEKGFRVFAPQLPNPTSPSLENWIETIVPIISKFRKKDIIIAHSGGSRAALHAIINCNKKLAHLFLFSPILGWDYFSEKFIERSRQANDDNWQSMNNFWSIPIDISLAEQFVPITAIFSSNDPIITPTAISLIPKNWDTERWENCKHFWSQEEPKMLELILKTISK